jgi:hypothetical protein
MEFFQRSATHRSSFSAAFCCQRASGSRQAGGVQSRRQHQRPAGADGPRGGVACQGNRSGDRGRRVEFRQHGHRARADLPHFGLRFTCVGDSKTSAQNLRVLRAYGDRGRAGGQARSRLRRTVAGPAQPRPGLGLADLMRLLAQTVRQPAQPGTHYRRRCTRSPRRRLPARSTRCWSLPASVARSAVAASTSVIKRVDTRLVAVDAAGSMIFSNQRGASCSL